MTDHDTGGTPNGCDDEANDWTEDDRVRDAAIAETNTWMQRNECIHDYWPGDLRCILHYNHDGLCVPLPAALWADERAYVRSVINAQAAS